MLAAGAIEQGGQQRLIELVTPPVGA